MEISLKTLKRIGMILLILGMMAAALLITSATWLPYMPWYSPPALTGEQVALLGSEIFHSMDYQRGQEAWLAEICEIASDMGCEQAEFFFGPLYWDNVMKEQKRVKADALRAEMVADLVMFDTHFQVWKVDTKMVNLWDDDLFEMEVHVLIQEDEESGAWQYTHVMMDSELEALLAEVENE